jgi:hypothetical protein
LAIRDGTLSTTALHVGDRDPVTLDTTELALILHTATWRRDIAIWRWRTTTSGTDEGLADPGLDVSDWRIVPHLHPVFDATTAADSWFRTELSIDHDAGDGPITIGLGGLDDEDWSSYAVYLDGSQLDAWDGHGRIREPHRIVLDATDPRNAGLRDGRPHVLAVRARGLQRSSWRVQPGEREHYFYQGWLLDQYVAVGTPTTRVDDFVVERHEAMADGGHVVVLRSWSFPMLSATIGYAGTNDGIRKRIEVTNGGTKPITVLDVVVEDWRGHLDASGGGRGQPVHLGQTGFAGIEHPAGVNQCDRDRLLLVQMPGATVAAGATWVARPAIVGAAVGHTSDEAFRAYVRGLRPRPDARLRVYSPLGWYDFTNPADPLPELTADLVAENLKQLRDLRADGGAFDVYMIDDWWEPTDLGAFRRRTFPDGHTPVAGAIRYSGMEPGLWWATTRALWTSSEAPGVDKSLANHPDYGAPVALAGGAWRWLEEFGNLFIGERRFCLASEPYRSMFLEAIPNLAEELGLALLKLDCVVLHCTSSEHDHWPGRHSVEPMIDALEALIDRCTRVQPGIRVVWYWGFRSPWYLALGDMVFDKGLLMEAATPASAPLPTSRQAMSLNIDQSIEHASTTPLELQDSLGVWIGDVAWCNRVGRHEWQEAYLLDAARGSDLVQLWGDLTLLNTDDRAFLATIQPWIERLGSCAGDTRRIGGSAWRQDAYGYLRPADGGILATLANPTWSGSSITIDRDTPGFPSEPWRIIELYPYPGLLEPSRTFDLAPHEVRVIRILPVSMVPRELAPTRRPLIRSTQWIDAQGLDVSPGTRPGRVSADMLLPTIGLGDSINVMHRLSRQGHWTYDPEPQAMIRFEALLDGLNVRYDTVPRHRDRNGPGSSWVLHRIPAGPAWSGRTLRTSIIADLPDGIDLQTAACALDEWWVRALRTFDDPIGR